MLKLIRQIAGDRRGNATIDFAFLLPIMLMLLIGVVEVTNVLRLDHNDGPQQMDLIVLRLDQKVVSAAQTVADLVTQRREVSDADLSDIFTAADLIFDPYPTAASSIGVVGVRYDPTTGAPSVDWTRSVNGGSVPDALTLATGLGSPGDGVVVVRASYAYTPVFFDFIMGPTTIEETAILRPRRSSYVVGPTP